MRLRAILRKAEREWEWLEKAPFVRMRKEENHRIQWITEKEAAERIANRNVGTNLVHSICHRDQALAVNA